MAGISEAAITPRFPCPFLLIADVRRFANGAGQQLPQPKRRGVGVVVPKSVMSSWHGCLQLPLSRLFVESPERQRRGAERKYQSSAVLSKSAAFRIRRSVNGRSPKLSVKKTTNLSSDQQKSPWFSVQLIRGSVRNMSFLFGEFLPWRCV